jgi:ribonuclease E
MNRTKQELSRDYQQLSRLWKEIQKRADTLAAPSPIYQESDFGVCTLRDYFSSEIEEILVDDLETFRKMRVYCKTVMPRNVKIIKNYKEKTPIFEKYRLEEQIRVIYQERVDLKSGGYLIINPTEAMITIDVNSGRGSNKRNVEETAFRTNMEAAEEIARQLRLRDLGGLIVIDFIDMMDRQHNTEVEKTFKKALSVDRARIQLSRISKFGMLELSRQKKQSTIQEISYTACPYCKGTGFRPALEYIALSAFRKIESQAVRGLYAHLKVSLPYAVADYLLNQKRVEISKIETSYEMAIHISGEPDMPWDELKIQSTERTVLPEIQPEPEMEEPARPERSSGAGGQPPLLPKTAKETEEEGAAGAEEPEERPAVSKKKPRRRTRHKKKKNLDAPPSEGPVEAIPTDALPAETMPAALPPVAAAELPVKIVEPAVSKQVKPAVREKAEIVVPEMIEPAIPDAAQSSSAGDAPTKKDDDLLNISMPAVKKTEEEP